MEEQSTGAGLAVARPRWAIRRTGRHVRTEVAKRPEMIKWADDRASFGVIPESVLEEWGIDLEKERAS